MFNTKWEIRHGAATAIREIIKHHGQGAGKAITIPSDQVYYLKYILCNALYIMIIYNVQFIFRWKRITKPGWKM